MSLQAAVLHALREKSDANGLVRAGLREIAKVAGTSHENVRQVILRLQDKGIVKVTSGQRGIRASYKVIASGDYLAPDEIVEDEHINNGTHTIVRGRCGDEVTAADIRERFYHPVFGGREALVLGGWFSVIVHTD